MVCNWKIEKDGTFIAHVEVPHCSCRGTSPGKEQMVPMQEVMISHDELKENLRNLMEEIQHWHELQRWTGNGEFWKYTPALAGIAASGDPEMGANFGRFVAHGTYHLTRLHLETSN